MRSKRKDRSEKGRYDVKGFNRRSWGDNVPKKNTRQILANDTRQRYEEYVMDASADNH